MKRLIKKEGGFTLIELLVVILIIGILIAVAAPSFLGQTQKANDSAAKQYNAVAYRAAKAYAVDGVRGNGTTPEPEWGGQGSFSGFDNTGVLDSFEPNSPVTIVSASGDDLELSTLSGDGPRECTLTVTDGVLDDPQVCTTP